MIICDVCGKAKDCLLKEIEGKEYDICSDCWNPFAQKAKTERFGDIKNIKQATGLTLPALSYGVILPFGRTIREFYAHRKAIPCFWQTIGHCSDLQKFSR